MPVNPRDPRSVTETNMLVFPGVLRQVYETDGSLVYRAHPSLAGTEISVRAVFRGTPTTSEAFLTWALSLTISHVFCLALCCLAHAVSLHFSCARVDPTHMSIGACNALVRPNRVFPGFRVSELPLRPPHLRRLAHRARCRRCQPGCAGQRNAHDREPGRRSPLLAFWAAGGDLRGPHGDGGASRRPNVVLASA